MKHLGKHERGGFDGWEIEEIEEKLLALATVIQSHRPMCLSVHAQWSEYNKFAKQSDRAKYIQSPYKALFHEVTRLTYGVGLSQGDPQSVDFVFDDQGEIGDEAAGWYREIKAAFPSEARPFFGTTSFGDDSKVLPLQAADMFAWFYRRRIWKPVIRPAFQRIEKWISEGFLAGSELDSESFEKAAIQFEKVAQWRDLLGS
jgi:hypothetical protein